MSGHSARCACGALSIVADHEPLKISVCHCKACQRRTGSAFGVAVFFDRTRTTPDGASQSFVRLGDSGEALEFHFCLSCGSTVYWYPAFRPGLVAVAIGCMEDDGLLPAQEVYTEHRRPWAAVFVPTI